jgi:cell shape-determining protein MreC
MKKRSKYALSVLVGLMVLLLVLQTPLMRVARDQAWSVWVATFARWFSVGLLEVPNNVSEQLSVLQAENSRLKAENIDYQRIRQQINSPAYSDFRQISSEIIGHPPNDIWKSQYIVNRGAEDGLVLGAPAVIYGSTVVGFIVELNPKTAVLQLVFHPATSLQAEVIAHEHTGRGLAKGKLFTGVELVTIPRDVKLQPEQDVVTVAQENVVPYGLLIGKIGTIKDAEHEPYKQAQLIVPYRENSIRAITFLVSK